MPTSNFYIPAVLKTAQTSRFCSHLEFASFAYPRKPHPTPAGNKQDKPQGYKDPNVLCMTLNPSPLVSSDLQISHFTAEGQPLHISHFTHLRLPWDFPAPLPSVWWPLAPKLQMLSCCGELPISCHLPNPCPVPLVCYFPLCVTFSLDLPQIPEALYTCQSDLQALNPVRFLSTSQLPF